MRMFLVLLLLSSPALATAPTPAQLAELRANISELEQALRSDTGERDGAQAALREVELKLSRLNREQRSLEQRRRDAAAELERLEVRQRRMAAERGVQLDWVAKTIRADYINGRQELVRLLLNQQEPDRVARMLRYQEYFQRARYERVTTINRDLEELLLVVLETEAARESLEQRRAEILVQQQALDSARRERSETLATINQRIGSTEQRLARMRQDAARLDTLLNDMGRTLSDIPARPSGEPFGKLANKLPWPVPRRITARFGSPREGSVRWNGVLLDAAAGTPVRAIHPGRVVFANWLRGYGMLIIVDHGDSFLSLYGHNQSLLREVGEWVSTGDVLAQVGDSGGFQQNGLYFEIRRAGVPVNPDQWCNSRVTLPPIASRPIRQ